MLKSLGPASIAGILLVASSCQASGTNVVTEDVVRQIPFLDGEVATYELTDDDGNSEGSGTLAVAEPDSRHLLAQDFADEEGNVDCWRVIADDNLKPIGVNRRIVRIDDGEPDEVTIRGVYGDGFAESVFASGDESRSEEGNVPQHAYDSLTEVFLVRTLDFEEGLQVAYNSVFVARPDGRDIATDPVIFEVEGRETIEVPFGEFETWRIGIRGGFGADRTAWVSVDEPYFLVRFDFGFLLYELESFGMNGGIDNTCPGADEGS
ncbi:MAG: DUF3108 domain-containing protein [Dehalococcoidia bacterium]